MNKLIYSLLLLICVHANLYSNEDYYIDDYASYQEAKEVIPSTGIVVFGATGDLVKRKIIPALVQLSAKNRLPEDYIIIGVGRRELSNEQFHRYVSNLIPPEDQQNWNKVKANVIYISGQLESEELYKKIANVLRRKKVLNHLFYLATPSGQYPNIVKGLYTEDLLTNDYGSVKVLFEKPFGKDKESARVLQEEISRYLNSDQASYVDHYLGKSIIRAILDFRKKFERYELLWNRIFVQSVNLVLSEDIGIEGRGSFWEETGLLRDVVQNHAMQIISLLAMDMPSKWDAASLSKNKARVIKSMQPIDMDEDELPRIIRGQYSRGISLGEVVPAYREENNVSPNSNVETFVAANLFVDNYRWKDVPFFVKAGKRLAEKQIQVDVQLKPVMKTGGNRIVFSVYPVEEIYYLDITNAKHVLYTPDEAKSAYENIFEDALRGDFTHFATFKEIQAAWKLFTPVINYWKHNPPSDFPNYDAGSDGPDYTLQ